MIDATDFLGLCSARGVSFISGTPCSYLKPLINAAIDDPRFLFCDAVNEGDAVAMAAGATLAGRSALVMFQNSGLGNAVNTLTSLCHPCRVPVLLVVTHRGEPGGVPDEPQHELMGRITPTLLETMGIAWEKFPTDPALLPAALDRAFASMTARELPFAFILSTGTIAPHMLKTKTSGTPIGRRDFHFSEDLKRPTAERTTRTKALEHIRAARVPGEVLVATTGYTGRELYALGDDPGNFYMVGSMGSASAFALGLALHVADRRVTVIDGDGAALMRLGNFATLGASAPAGLTHIVLDNEVHDSTGGQSTVSRGVAFAAIAQACGYANVLSTDEPAAFAAALAAPRTDGANFIHFRIRPGAPNDLPRPTVTPAEVFHRLQSWLVQSVRLGVIARPH